LFFDVKNLMKVGESPLQGFPTKRQSPSGGGQAAGRHCGSGGSRHGSPDRLREHCRVREGLRSRANVACSRDSAAALKRRGGRMWLRLPDVLLSTGFGWKERGCAGGIPPLEDHRSLLWRSTGRAQGGRTSVRPNSACQYGISGMERSVTDLEEEQSPWKDRVLRHRQRWCDTTDSLAE
jgi:hypothetical protein